jgi:hypothetical protein
MVGIYVKKNGWYYFTFKTGNIFLTLLQNSGSLIWRLEVSTHERKKGKRGDK